MKTRIRIERSEHGEYYFPEYLKIKKRFLRKDKEEWRRIHRCYDEWWISMTFDNIEKLDNQLKEYTEIWAKKVIDLSWTYWNELEAFKQHQDKKEIYYVKYP